MDAHEVGGLRLLREMWDFSAGVPEDERLDYLKAIIACARGDGVLAPAERSWVIGYGAASGAPQALYEAERALKRQRIALVFADAVPHQERAAQGGAET